MNDDFEAGKAFIREKVKENADQVKNIVDEISYQKYRIRNILSILAGAILLAIGVVLFWRDYSSVSHREKVTGTVSGFQNSVAGTTAKKEVSKIIITYTYKGETKTITGNTASNVQTLNEGDAVNLLIDPKNPNDIIIDIFMERYPIMLACGGLGLILLITGVRKVFF